MCMCVRSSAHAFVRACVCVCACVSARASVFVQFLFCIVEPLSEMESFSYPKCNYAQLLVY